MDYQDGFEDGVKFAREVIVTNKVMDDVADRLEFGTVDYDL